MAKQPFDLYALDPAAKREMEAEDRFKADLKTKNKFPARPKTGSTARSAAPPARNMQTQGDGSRLTAGYDPVTDRFFRALGNTLGNQNVTENLRFIDKNLLNMSNAENAAFNFGRGEGTLSDAIDIALAAPMAGVVAKPLGVVGRGLRTAARMTPGAERVANLAARVAQSRPVQYMAEARPVLDNADDAIETAFTVTPGVQRRITNQRPVVRGLPAPEQRLGLPAPGPGLPDFAAKPRGGQFWPDVDLQKEFRGDHITKTLNEMQGNMSPEAAARLAASVSANDPAVQAWLERALTKYYKTDFGAPDDPLRSLAERGLHYEADMTPERWRRLVNDYITEDDIGAYTVPGQPHVDPEEASALLKAAPWLAKQPVTDKLYGISGGGLELSHFADELKNALNPEASGLPPELALRPESLDRMSFAAAAERVGRINQFRAKQMQEAALNSLNSPAASLFKEYPENNPMGLRWVELRAPEMPEGYTLDEATGEIMTPYGSNGPAGGAGDPRRPLLEEALRYEGDTMGHCVGGYCPDVMSGRSRIFSLRDAKGEPHVTIETTPGKAKAVLASGRELNEDFLASAGLSPRVARDVLYAVDRDKPIVSHLLEARKHVGYGSAPYREYEEAIPFISGLDYTRVPGPEDIVQIKGKQNRAPKENYLPFVQDFVKSGQWGGVGDLENTGLVRLPDGRYITAQQWQEGINAVESPWRDPTQYDERYLDRLSKAEWEHMAPYFKGYARGGRAFAAKPCSCDHSLAVR